MGHGFHRGVNLMASETVDLSWQLSSAQGEDQLFCRSINDWHVYASHMYVFCLYMNMIWIWYEHDMSMIWIIWHSDIPKKTYQDVHVTMSFTGLYMSSNRAPRWHAPWSSCTFGPSWARTYRLMLVKCQWKSRKSGRNFGNISSNPKKISWDYRWLESYDIPSDPMRNIIMSLQWNHDYPTIVITKIERCEYPTIVIQL